MVTDGVHTESPLDRFSFRGGRVTRSRVISWPLITSSRALEANGLIVDHQFDRMALTMRPCICSDGTFWAVLRLSLMRDRVSNSLPARAERFDAFARKTATLCGKPVVFWQLSSLSSCGRVRGHYSG
jgi:hypothetical protein